MKLKRIAIDIAKHVFTLHGVDEHERPVVRRNLKRAEMEAFFGKLPGTEVVTEACGGAHHWGRLLTRLGHTVRLIPARAAAINALRGHATEFGVIAGKGTANVQPLLDRLADDAAIPTVARAMFARMGEQIVDLDRQIAALDAELLAQHKANPVSRLLAEAPGIRPVTAITLALGIDIKEFASGRHFAAWLGLTPKEHSTGGKQRMGRISKAGNERLRSLLVVGATAVIRHLRPGKPPASAWLLALVARKPKKLAAVALANKTARIVWAMMSRGGAYRRQPVTA